MIHDVQVCRDDGTVRRVVVLFGKGYEIDIKAAPDGRLNLTLAANGIKVNLDAKKIGCSYERAINILRLHMPCCRDTDG